MYFSFISQLFVIIAMTSFIIRLVYQTLLSKAKEITLYFYMSFCNLNTYQEFIVKIMNLPHLQTHIYLHFDKKCKRMISSYSILEKIRKIIKYDTEIFRLFLLYIFELNLHKQYKTGFKTKLEKRKKLNRSKSGHRQRF